MERWMVGEEERDEIYSTGITYTYYFIESSLFLKQSNAYVLSLKIFMMII
jgi:hypothetical protein